MKILFILSLSLLFTPLFHGQSERPFSRETVSQMLATGDILSVEDFLLAVSESGPEDIFDNYVFMFHSRSRQEGSFGEPRAIIFSPKQEFVLAFNGGDHQRGGKLIEMMQFNREQRAFEFFEVDFSGPSPHLSQINPPRCQTCHRTDPRPNWEHYFFWQGMYGGDDDRLIANVYLLIKEYGKDALKNPSQPIRAKYPDIVETQEGQKYLQFMLDKRPRHPRYSLLREYPIPSMPGYPLPYSRSPRPGLALTRLLVGLNQQRIQRDTEAIVEQVPHFKYALLGALNNCIRSPEYLASNFFPPHFFEREEVKPEVYWQNSIHRIEMDTAERIRRHEILTGDDTSQRGRLRHSGGTVRIRNNALLWAEYIIQLSGLEKHNWSLSLSNVPIIFDGRYFSLVESDFLQSLLGQEYKDSTFHSNKSQTICDYLADKSRQIIKEVYNKKNKKTY